MRSLSSLAYSRWEEICSSSRRCDSNWFPCSISNSKGNLQEGIITLLPFSCRYDLTYCTIFSLNSTRLPRISVEGRSNRTSQEWSRTRSRLQIYSVLSMKRICLRWSRSMIMLPPQIRFLRRLLKNSPFFFPRCVFRQKRCSSKCFWIRINVRCSRENSQRGGQGSSCAYFSRREVVARMSPVVGGLSGEGILPAAFSSDSDNPSCSVGGSLPPPSPSLTRCSFLRTLSIPMNSSSSCVACSRFWLFLRRKSEAWFGKSGSLTGRCRSIRYEYIVRQFE